MPNHNPYLDHLRERGYRITPQRELILGAVSPTSSHFTAEMVFDQVRQKSTAVNVATIYRTLDLLVEEGLISRSDFGQGQIIYATQEHGPHLHLVCRLCGEVTAAEIHHAESLKQSLQREKNFQLDLTHLTAFGLCENCH
jgi:Fur family ferric uptake transcriptional regulator